MSAWANLVIPTFKCGHEKAADNMMRCVVRGKLCTRCRECHRAAAKAWMAKHHVPKGRPKQYKRRPVST